MSKTSKKSYSKPPLAFSSQISLLKKRGLVVTDEKQLEYFLKNISYYHLSIYFKFFQTNDVFLPGTTFEDVVQVYTFDNKLRFLLLELLERIEKSFKCRVAYELSLPGEDSHCHLTEDLFRDSKTFQDTQNLFEEVFEKSKEVSIDHYKRKYDHPPLPPVCMMIEILSFGQCVKFVKNLKRENKNKVSRTFGVDEKFALNWMHCLSVLRNNCAHHSRLWNREQTLFIKTNHNRYQKYFIPGSKRLYNYLVSMQIVLSEVNPTSSWLDKLTILIEEHKIDISHMGFPEDWYEKLNEIMKIDKSE